MSINKIKIILLFVLVATSCKLPTYSFQESDINRSLFQNMPIPSSYSVDSVVLFRAVMKKELVERDGVPELKVLDSFSKQPRVEFMVITETSYLFLARLYLKGYTKNKVWVFLSLKMDAGNHCLGFDPVYFGYERINQITMNHRLHLAEGNNGYYIKKADTANMYWIVKDTARLSKILADRSMLKIGEILQLAPNSIGGRKPVVFNIPRVFNDSNALSFIYYKTVK